MVSHCKLLSSGLASRVWVAAVVSVILGVGDSWDETNWYQANISYLWGVYLSEQVQTPRQLRSRQTCRGLAGISAQTRGGWLCPQRCPRQTPWGTRCSCLRGTRRRDGGCSQPCQCPRQRPLWWATSDPPRRTSASASHSTPCPSTCPRSGSGYPRSPVYQDKSSSSLFCLKDPAINIEINY